jgi:hypothetical protein
LLWKSSDLLLPLSCDDFTGYFFNKGGLASTFGSNKIKG